MVTIVIIALAAAQEPPGKTSDQSVKLVQVDVVVHLVVKG